MPEAYIKLYDEMKRDSIYQLPENPNVLWYLLQSILLYLSAHNEILNEDCIEQYFELLMNKDVNFHAANVASDYFTSQDDSYKKAMQAYDNYRCKSFTAHYKMIDGIVVLCEMYLYENFYQVCKECLKTIYI